MFRAMVIATTTAVVLSLQTSPLDIAVVNIRAGGGEIFTGTAPGGAPVDAIGIRDGRIVAIGPTRDIDAKNARVVIDATGLIVSPGFIDVHSHGLETLGRAELRNADAELAQGVTMIVGNPDGGGPVDLAKQRAMLEGSGGIGVNVALARAAGGVYTSHIRDEGNYDVGVVASVDEVIRVAEEAKVTASSRT